MKRGRPAKGEKKRPALVQVALKLPPGWAKSLDDEVRRQRVERATLAGRAVLQPPATRSSVLRQGLAMVCNARSRRELLDWEKQQVQQEEDRDARAAQRAKGRRSSRKRRGRG